MTTQTKTAVVRARIEPHVKESAERVLGKLGLTSSEAISVFYHKIIAEQGIPFSLALPNRETREVIQATRKKKNVNVFTSVADWKRQLG